MTEISLNEKHDLLLGKSVAGYQFITKLGQGAFGAVYLARHPRLNRNVAVKYIQLQDSEEFESVEREVHILEQLQHNHIVRIDDTLRFENYQLIMMELVKGGSLRGLLQKLKGDLLDTQTIVALIDQVAQALDYVHEQQILHLDLKPENILVDVLAEDKTPRFVLTDFGIARFTRPDGQFSNLAGTPPYMSPEQFEFEHGRIDQRTDVYALGIILYELIVGHAPFRARMLHEIARQHLHETPVSPSLLVPGLPAEIENVILRALVKNPEERFQSAGAFSSALKAASHQTGGRTKTIDGMTLKLFARENAEALDLFSVKDEGTAPATDLSPADTSTLRLGITGPDGIEKIQTFQKTFIIVGRQPDVDLVLADNQVSRQHARIDGDIDGKMYITDLGSRAGTFLNGDRLLPHQRYTWTTEQYLTLRGFLLRPIYEPVVNSVSAAPHQSNGHISSLDADTAATDAAVENLSPGELISLLNRVQEDHQQPRILFQVSPEVIHVRSGRPYYLKAHVKPQNAPTTTYRLQISHGPGGIDESWYTLPAPKVIASGESQSFDMTITAPMVKTGVYQMFIGIVADDSSVPDAAQIVKVVIEPTLQYTLGLKPSVLSHRLLPWKRQAILNIQNHSNFSETFIIDVKAHDRLKVHPENTEFEIADRASRNVKLWITPRRGANVEGRLWYTVAVRPKSGDAEKSETGSYAFPPGIRSRPSLFGIVVSAGLLMVSAYVFARLTSGASIEIIWSEIVNFLISIRVQIESIIRGLSS